MLPHPIHLPLGLPLHFVVESTDVDNRTNGGVIIGISGLAVNLDLPML
jgi:hypothetical protein